jgi:hypothetical protein
MKLLCRYEGETGGEIEAHLVAEERPRACARAVLLFGAVLQHSLHQIQVLPHGADIIRAAARELLLF